MDPMRSTSKKAIFSVLVMCLFLGLLPGLGAIADQPVGLNPLATPDSWDLGVVKAVDSYVVRQFMFNGKQVNQVTAPARPPIGFRMPVANPPESNKAMGISALTTVPAFDWSYGCSATSASMMAGYYDNAGYPNMYTGPTNGGVCPMNNSAWGPGECPLSATHQGYDGLAVKGHVDDYWGDPDPYVGNWAEHTWADCTGDYMGTNQAKFGNGDGATTFFYYTDGTPLDDYSGSEPTNKDGCHGLAEFMRSRGYTVVTNYTQMIYPYDSNTAGFSFEQFMDEIDNGRPVLIQLAGHTMLGYGYDTNGQVIYVHDTWDYSDHTMVWGGSYGGMQQWGVTVVHLIKSLAVTIDQAATQADPTSASPINFTVEFSNPVSDFATGDVTLSGTAGATTAIVTGSGTTYNVAVSGMTSIGTVVASIAAGVAHDAGDNSNSASTSTDNTVTYSPSAPTNKSLTPSSGTLTTTPMTFTSVYQDQNGYADIKRAYLLISDSLDYSKGVLLFYDAQGNRVYLYNPSSGLGTGYAPGSDVTLVNGQCFFYIKDTTVSRSGNELTVNWKVALRSEFLSRSLNGYAYVKDGLGLTAGWDRMGIFYNAQPHVVSIDPNNGVLPIDAKTSMTSVFRDLNGSSDLRICRLFINDALGSGNAVFLWYDKVSNKVYLKDDANASWGTGYAPGTDVTLSNSQCEVYVKDITVTAVGNDLTVVWSFKLKPSMSAKNLCSWMYVNDSGSLFDGWKKMGTYYAMVAPTSVSVTPSSGLIPTGTPVVFSTDYADGNGYSDLSQCYFQVGQSGSLAHTVCVLYDAAQGKVFLRDDANASWGTGQIPGTNVTLENSQCIVYVKDIVVTPGGSDNLLIDWKITLKPSLIGKLLGERMFCRDNEYLNSGWHLKGYVRGQ